MKPIIQMNGVGKVYHKKESPFAQADMFWVLKDVSFALKPGESLGLIGVNGAGKTTLMRLIAGITAPTLGTVSVQGTVAPLLAMEGCLHPFLNATENISLMMSFHGIPFGARKNIVPQILEFSGLTELSEMPTRRYSTGMRSRLSFGIAAFLPMDILLIDEMLAAGDQEFQVKCVRKIESLKKEGKTVLFTSHLAEDIGRVCDRVLWIEKGHIFRDGPTAEVLKEYIKTP